MKKSYTAVVGLVSGLLILILSIMTSGDIKSFIDFKIFLPFVHEIDFKIIFPNSILVMHRCTIRKLLHIDFHFIRNQLAFMIPER